MILEHKTTPSGNKVSRPAVILVDWNGTCIEEHWGGSGTWIPGAKEALQKLVKKGYTVKIHSLVHHSKEFDTIHDRGYGERAGVIAETRKQLDDAGLQEVEIIMEDKIPALWVIDDKAIRFNGNWRKVLREIGV